MPAPGQSTFDGNPNLTTPTTQGYRPGPDDFNGAQLQDLGTNPPNPTYCPTSALFNTDSLQLVSVSRMIPWGSASVLAGVSPSLQYWRVAANNIKSGTGTSGSPFTVTRNGAGDYSLTYATGQFPSPVAQPEARLNVQLGAHNYSIGAINITNGVRVTTTQDGVLTDLNFSVDFI